VAEPAAPAGGHKSQFGFLARKIGPVPIWLIGVVIAGGIYWYFHYGPGATKAAAAAQTSTGKANADEAEIIRLQQEVDDLRHQKSGTGEDHDKDDSQPHPRSHPVHRLPGQGPHQPPDHDPVVSHHGGGPEPPREAEIPPQTRWRAA